MYFTHEASGPKILLWVCWAFLKLLLQSLGFCGGSDVMKLPAMRETQVQFLGRENPLENEMGIHSSILAWRTPWTGELGGLQSMGSVELDMTEQLTHFQSP